jgi:hypothetical protein
MSQAYSPGLKRKEYDIIQKIRRLPVPGKVLVKEGDVVSPTDIVAETHVEGQAMTVNAGAFLGLEPEETRDGYSCELNRYMLKKQGDVVRQGETICRRSSLFGLIKVTCESPIDGTIEVISDMSGQIVIRRPPIPVRLPAHVPGKVTAIMPEQGCIIETPATYIQGIIGIGGEMEGEIKMVADTASDVLTDKEITTDAKGKIIVGGSLITREGLRKALEVGAVGVLVGGIDNDVLNSFLGYEMGVAITGNEEIGLTLVVTEGFGEMRMSEKTFELLNKRDGYLACIDGSTQIRAGVIRPEIIIPLKEQEASQIKMEASLDEGMKPGLPIRIIRSPYFGALATIVSLPVDLQQVETESRVRVLVAELEDGRQVIVPRANVELIEE